MTQDVFTDTELQGYISHTIGEIVLADLFFVVYPLTSFFQKSFSPTSLIILLGAILSVVGVFSYGISILLFVARNKKSLWVLVLMPLEFISYLYYCYLIFYIGVWGIIGLFGRFSFWSLVVSIISILLGYYMIRKYWLITELGRAISNKKISIIS